MKLQPLADRVIIEPLSAEEVTKGDQVLELRDASGVPMWAGWRARGAQPPQTPQP